MAKKMMKGNNFNPVGYYISPGKVVNAAFLFPKADYNKHVVKIDIECYDLTFAKLSMAINAISLLIAQKTVFKVNVLVSEIRKQPVYTLSELMKSKLVQISGHKIKTG